MLSSLRSKALPVFAVLLMVLAACGSDDPETASSPSGDAGQAEPPTAGPSDETPPSAESPAEEAPAEGGQDAAPGRAMSFQELMERYGDVLEQRGQVVYDVSAPGMEGRSQMTIAQDPPRHAFLVESADGSFHTIAGGPDVSCFASGSDWQCMSADMGLGDLLDGGLLDDMVDLDDLDQPDFDPESVTITETTIIGRAAICLEVPESDGVTNLVMCLDEETGLMLRTSGDTTEGSFLMEATSFSDPDAAMFTPPGEIIEMPALPTG